MTAAILAGLAQNAAVATEKAAASKKVLTGALAGATVIFSTRKRPKMFDLFVGMTMGAIAGYGWHVLHNKSSGV